MDTLLDGLPLRRASSPLWAGIALDNLDEVLIDHAYCEHKAATTHSAGSPSRSAIARAAIRSVVPLPTSMTMSPSLISVTRP